MLRIARPSQARTSQRSLLSFVTATCLLSASVIPAVAVPTAQANQPQTTQAAQASNTAQATQSAPATYNRFIITYTDEAKNAASTDATADQIDWSAAAGTQQATWADALYTGITSDVQSIDELLNIKTSYVRSTALDASVVTTSAALTPAQAQQYMNALSANSKVASVSPDMRRYATVDNTSAPVKINDPKMNRMWSLTGEKGISALEAWGTTRGQGVTVAVLDSGITAHPDLDANVLPGYDFIAESAFSNDGNGRDSDPTDAGNWTVDDQCFTGSKATPSDWHGTHVAGTIAAIANNNEGIAGVAPEAKIVPVRVLGACGGFDSDITDGIIWAAGGSVRGVPANQHPAQVINMSIGSEGTCTTPYRQAIAQANKRGSIVVVAAGNNNFDASKSSPGNCEDVITVGATDKNGKRSYFSNYGSRVDVSAPGGDRRYWGGGILSTLNAGKTAPGKADYAEYQGTSMAAPHVAGIVALMKAVDPKLTYAQVKKVLQSTSQSVECDQSACGSGIVNAARAVQQVRSDREAAEAAAAEAARKKAEEEAARKKAAEEAARKKAEEDAKRHQAPAPKVTPAPKANRPVTRPSRPVTRPSYPSRPRHGHTSRHRSWYGASANTYPSSGYLSFASGKHR
ncbi:S8 family serine peptidase [Rothia mucilaginosa]|uniref:S8 family serine peptidase n=1 Tax=Rothia mucilaginosa TaxID=43675 RepID=A0A943T683_9MICC|nr:S8 family serine peptidase [Rothia mucilaginosa]MBS6634131.1 S8 family serine peptidase [Rothia mucilaginosa]